MQFQQHNVRVCPVDPNHVIKMGMLNDHILECHPEAAREPYFPRENLQQQHCTECWDYTVKNSVLQCTLNLTHRDVLALNYTF